MKKILALLLLGSAIAYLRARQRSATGALAHSGEDMQLGHAPVGMAVDHAMPAMTSLGDSVGLHGQMEGMGIADVDPVPLSGMGEGIDPDANAAAHNEIREQNERVKNLP